MVDLVKIRQKAKERKQESDRVSREAPVSPPAVEESSRIATADERKAAPAGKKVPEEEARKKRPALGPGKPAVQPPGPAADAVMPASPAPSITLPARSAAAQPASGEKLERFRETAGRAVVRDAPGSTVVAETEEKPFLELLTFVLSGETYAVEIERIVEIIQPRTATPIPNAGESILGIVSLRGTIVTILDLRRRLGHPTQSRPGEGSKIVVVESAGETAGFLVDRVLRVIKLDPSLVGHPPVVVSGEQNEFIRGVFQQAQKLVILLDLNKILGS